MVFKNGERIMRKKFAVDYWFTKTPEGDPDWVRLSNNEAELRQEAQRLVMDEGRFGCARLCQRDGDPDPGDTGWRELAAW